MTEQLTDNEKAYDLGQQDAADGHCIMVSYHDWCECGFIGSHASYKAGFEDYTKDNLEVEEQDERSILTRASIF